MMFIGFLAIGLITFGIILIFDLTPDRVSEDILKILHKENSLIFKAKIAQGEAKRSRIRTALLNVYNALEATNQSGKFALFCVLSLGGMTAGCMLSAITGKWLLLLPLAAVGIFLPYLYVQNIVSAYNKKVSEELETALSIITSAYIGGGDIIHAVESCVEYIHAPVQNVFKEFLGKSKLISSNTKLAIEEMKNSLNNEIFREWCDNLIACEVNSSLKMTLHPIAVRLSEIRLVNAELETMLTAPRMEFITLLALTTLNIPVIRLMSKSWSEILFGTIQGQIVLAVNVTVILISSVLCYIQTRPLEFKK